MGCILEFLYELFCEFIFEGSLHFFEKHIKRDRLCRVLAGLVGVAVLAGVFGVVLLIIRLCSGQ